MDWASKELVGVIYYLLPGFLAAWVFHGLTAHPKASPFERIVQALVLTAILQGVVSIVRWGCLAMGGLLTLGDWTENVGLVWSLVLAVVLGAVLAGFTNSDTAHSWLRSRSWKLWRAKEPGKVGWTWTRRTSHPSEWFSAFSHHSGRYVILHLRDGRRLYGWPDEWPDTCERGHFVMSECEWLLDNNERAGLHRVESMLVPATAVELVEFLKYDREVEVDAEELAKAEELLIASNQKEESPSGNQNTAAAPEPP